jgi:iron complex outermembrane recepter protein
VRRTRRPHLALLVVYALLVPALARAQPSPAQPSPAWKQLTIQELLDIDVTTAARREDPIRVATAPVQVLTRDDLHRAGVRTLAEAFRLADGLYVGRFDGRTWIVNARGLAINGANKMQVMIDGRSIYSPLYSGIFWDAQDVLMDDIERIEIIRGPGASLWGANSVHGIINVITRRAADTTGWLAVVGSGNEERAITDVRYGGRLNDSVWYRVYGKYAFRDAQVLADDTSAQDPLRRAQGGARLDWRLSDANELMLQGDAYAGRLGLMGSPDTDIGGGNVMARWTQRSAHGITQLQTYYDRVSRDVPSQFGERRNTFDVDAQHSLSAGRHALVFGTGYRASADDTDVTPIAFFDPKQRTTTLFNLFAQDEVALKGGIYATVGSKIEHNSYSGWEFQPTGRIRWTRGRDTLWGAVSRAVRMPTRFDTDIRFTGGQPVVLVSGSPDFRSETLISTEAGFRSQPRTNFSYEAAVYVNRYDDLRSQDPGVSVPIVLGNTVGGHIAGIELGATWEPFTSSRLHGSYTWLHRSIAPDPGSLDISGGEGNDAPHLATAQLFTNLTANVRFNVLGRYVAALPRPALPAYAEADVTLQWDVRPWAELAVTGQNLLHDRHPEFTSGQLTLEYYQRSAFVTLTLRRR